MGWSVVLIAGGAFLLFTAGVNHKSADAGTWVFYGTLALIGGFVLV